MRFLTQLFVSPATALPALLALTTTVAAGQSQILNDASLGKDTISRHIYGHFSEHLGRCIYGGYYVGEGNTKIPNTRGIRNDVVKALKKIRIPDLRCRNQSENASARYKRPGDDRDGDLLRGEQCAAHEMEMQGFALPPSAFRNNEHVR